MYLYIPEQMFSMLKFIVKGSIKMETNPNIIQFQTMQAFFNNSISVLTEEDSGFKPFEEAMTVAQLIGHVADTFDWFNDGTFSGKGFDMDFGVRMKDAVSLEVEKKKFNEAIEASIALWGPKSMEELMMPIENDNIMGGAPKIASIGAMADHTAHHRGALTVYTRLIGKTPKMPYDM
jgi:uncharacterized damage-inducible protein DinB